MNRLELVNTIKDLGADLINNAETYVPEDASNITSLYFDCDTNVADGGIPKINVHIERIPKRFLERHKGISENGTWTSEEVPLSKRIKWSGREEICNE